jgi:hypothetical protein
MRYGQLDQINREGRSRNDLYWLGNIAKSRIIGTMLGHSDTDRGFLIFDYGCGDGAIGRQY